MKNPNKSKNLSSGQRSYHQVYLEMWLYNKRPCRAAAGARALFAPVNLCESIRKFVQRLPINCPPDLPPRFVQDERKLTSAHQTHLGAWRDRRIFISVQDEGKVFPAAGVDVHVKQFTPLVDLVYSLDSFLLNICSSLNDPCRTHVPERVFISRCFFAAQVHKCSNSV